MLYADYNATTPCLPSVIESVTRALKDRFGNPSSRHHLLGRQAATLLEESRQAVATLIGAHSDEIIFTSGATEAANQAVIGVMQRLLSTRPRLLVSNTEHEAILEPARYCARAGAALTGLPVDTAGQLHPYAIAEQLDERIALVAIMLANNETGVIQDLPPLAEQVHQTGAFLLCDITQAVGKIPVDVHALGADLAVLSGHKCYAPKGCGVLFIRRGLRIDPLIYGGGQESGRRSGTENIPGIAGLGEACRYHQQHLPGNQVHLQHVKQLLEQELRQCMPGVIIHGDASPRLPGTSFIAHPDAAPAWLRRITRIALSPGSSCASGSKQASHVLRAMGIDETIAANSLRLSLGLATTSDEVADMVDHLRKTMPAR